VRAETREPCYIKLLDGVVNASERKKGQRPRHFPSDWKRIKGAERGEPNVAADDRCKDTELKENTQIESAVKGIGKIYQLEDALGNPTAEENNVTARYSTRWKSSR